MNITKKEQTMSSIEISELTDKRHDNVMRDIEKMFFELGESHSSFLRSEITNRGRTIYIYHLPREECTILISGYNVSLRAKIVRRWLELEEQAAPKIPQTFAEALRLAADKQEQIEQLEQQRQLEAPKVSFAEVVEGSESKISMGDFAKLSGKIGRNTLFKKLREDGVLQRNNRPYQRYLDAGYFEVSETVIKRTDGDMISFTTYVTGKGQLWLSKRIEAWG